MTTQAKTARVVALTGLGATTSIGGDAREMLQSLLQGKDGFKPAGQRMTTPAFREQLAATVSDELWAGAKAPRPEDDGSEQDPCVQLALHAASEAWRDAGLDAERVERQRVAIVLGTSAGGLLSRSLYERTPPEDGERRHRLLQRSDPTELTRAVAEALGIAGPRVTVSIACSSSTHALVHGRDLLLAGLADVVLAGGVEMLVEELMAGFHAMGALSSTPCAPFSRPIGLTLGEGAGFVVLERPTDAARRGARVRSVLLGTGLSVDGWHPTAPDPSGRGIASAMTAALSDAGVSNEAIAYLNAHGTGTEANDEAEWRAITRAFGSCANTLPVSSTKGHFGHALGAAGVLELIASVLCVQQRVLPPNLHFDGLRGLGPIDPIPGPKPRAAVCDTFLKSSSGFGGANAAIVVGSPTSPVPEASDLEDVLILGTGVVGPFGWEGYDAALRAGLPTWVRSELGEACAWVGRAPELPLSRFAPGIDLRGMPTTARFLIVAANRALKDARVSLRAELRRRVGLFVGAGRPPWSATRAFYASILERGLDRASAPAFAQMVMNAPAGLVASAMGIRGAQTVIAGRRGGALSSVALASSALAMRRDADALMVGAAAEASTEDLADHAAEFPTQPREHTGFDLYSPSSPGPVLGEGAALSLLAASRGARALGAVPIARVAACGAAGPAGLARALGDALARAGWRATDVDAAYGSADGRAESPLIELSALREHAPGALLYNPASVVGTSACLDAFAFVAAVEALRRGKAHDAIRAGERGADSQARDVKRVVVMSDDALTGAWVVALEKCDNGGKPYGL